MNVQFQRKISNVNSCYYHKVTSTSLSRLEDIALLDRTVQPRFDPATLWTAVQLLTLTPRFSDENSLSHLP